MSVFFYLIAALWLGWLAYWIAAAQNVKAVARTESWQSRLAYSAPLWLAGVLLVNPHLGGVLSLRFMPFAPWAVVAGALLTAAGLGFAIWARVALGGNWSGEVTVKQDHELVQDGPYALARHPIYTGLSLAFLGTALAIGEWRGVIALALAVGSFVYKLGIEERAMRATFGAAWEAYARRVRALIPFIV